MKDTHTELVRITITIGLTFLVFKGVCKGYERYTNILRENFKETMKNTSDEIPLNTE